MVSVPFSVPCCDSGCRGGRAARDACHRANVRRHRMFPDLCSMPPQMREPAGSPALSRLSCARSSEPRVAAPDVWQSRRMGARYLKLKPFAAGRARRARHGETYAHRLHRRRPGWALFRSADEKGKSGAPRHRDRAEQALRHLRLGRGFLRCDHGEHAGLGPRNGARDRERVQSLGRHRSPGSRAGACARPATASSASAARSC